MKAEMGLLIFPSVLLVVGATANAVVIWIYTRKNSRVNKVGQREFPLLFAAIDLIALLSTIIGEVYEHMKYDTVEYRVFLTLFNFCFIFNLNGYLFGLITASVDKLYTVYFPFKYRLIHGKIIRMSISIVFGLGFAIPILILISGM